MATPMETGAVTEESPPPGILGEHCYSKVPYAGVLYCTYLNAFFVSQHPPSNEEPMETEVLPEPPTESSTPTTPILTSLDKSLDNFESLLLMLLRAYTVQSHPESSAAPSDSTVPISGKALDTLSAEQIKALITSNSVNYEVIQQILAEQKGRPAIASAARIRREGSNGSGQSDQVALLDEPRGDANKSPSPLCSPSLTTITDTNQQLQQLIQITPQQLEALQSQVNDLLQTQRVTLPTDLSPEQQQQLIQTLLLRQLHLQQSGGVASISLKDGSVAMKQLLAESEDQGQAKSSGLGKTVADALKTVEPGTPEVSTGGEETQTKVRISLVVLYGMVN